MNKMLNRYISTLPPQAPRKQRGLTLVELMIAMTVGLVLLGGITSIMISSRQTYKVNEAMSRMQDSARYAFQVLSRDVRMAGYFGCIGSDTSVQNNLSTSTSYLWNFGKAIEGYDATGAGWSPSADASIVSPLTGTDIIVIRGTAGEGSSSPIKIVNQPGGTPPGSADLKVGAGSGLADGDVVMASDCLAATAFQITNFSSAGGGFDNVVHNTGALGGLVPGNAVKELGHEYTGGELMKVSTRAYYIRTNSYSHPALYRIVGTTPAEELVEGVENMQIQYGEDTNGDYTADVYHTAATVVDWGKVVSVRIDLLMQTVDDNIASVKQPYTYNGSTTTPGDRRLRQVYSTVIALRNRAL